jgi:hypothetical protein
MSSEERNVFLTNKEELDQHARIALMDHFASHLRYWGTNILAIAIGFFAAFQAKASFDSFHVKSLETVPLV